MPFITSTVTTTYVAAICDICGAAEAGYSAEGTPDAREQLEKNGWLIVTVPPIFIGGESRPTGVLCPRCRPLLAHSDVQILSG